MMLVAPMKPIARSYRWYVYFELNDRATPEFACNCWSKSTGDVDQIVCVQLIGRFQGIRKIDWMHRDTFPK